MKKARVFVLVLIMIGLVVGYYFYLDHKNSKKKDEKELTEVEKLIEKNLTTSYPKTPREVIKLYNRIITCYYNEEYSNEELVRLTTQARLLFDDELLEKNPYEQFYENLCREIESYDKDNRRISSTFLANSREVEYYSIKKEKYASIQCVYYTKGDEGTIKSDETYVLRKDKDGEWKILYWKLTEADNEPETDNDTGN